MVRTVSWTMNDGLAGVVVTSAGRPASAAGRTRTNMSPWSTTNGTRGDNFPSASSLASSSFLPACARLVGWPLFVRHRLVGPETARVGHDGTRDAAYPAARELRGHGVEIGAAHRRVAAAAQVDVADHDAVGGRRGACQLGAKAPVGPEAHQGGRRRQHLLVRRRIHQHGAARVEK